MSNAIRYDSLLLATLARRLSADHAGRAIRGVWLDRPGRILTIRLAARIRRGDDTILRWYLNPSAGDLTVSDSPPDRTSPAGAGAGAGASIVQVAPGTALLSVASVPDERILCFDLDVRDAAAGFARRIMVELIGTRWNAIALGGDSVITAILQARERDGVQLRPGVRYVPPVARVRAGARHAPAFDDFAAVIRTAAAAEQSGSDDGDIRRALVQSVAYTSPINATYICAAMVSRLDGDTLRTAFQRYSALLASDDGFILAGGRGQPYPGALGSGDAEHVGSIVDAFNEVAARGAAPVSEPAGDVDAAHAAVHERIRRIDERIGKLSTEQRGAAEEADRLRTAAGLLLAQLHTVRRGASHVTLDAFDGTTLDVDLDASLGAKENAAKWYDQARRRELAAERVPSLLEKAGRERASLVELQGRLADGSASPEEIAHWSRPAAIRAKPGTTPVVLPYRVYHTSGDLEVRVGRNSRANDLLTLHHSSPDDIWLHARDLAGAHVVLRWGNRNAGPPARDLREAAVIAAVNSRGRTSGLVAVDWTRRKYVRKPRKAPPGRVMVERSKTLFVEPDADLDRRLSSSDP